MSERSEDRELTALETALRELRPQVDALNRDVLMYRAGRVSARGWVWPLATLVSTAAVLLLSIGLWIRPTPPVVYVAVPPVLNDAVSDSPSSALVEETERGAWSRYVHLQEQVLLYGLDGLPPSPSATDEPSPDADALFNSL
jgi:hypothetical protein